MRFILVSSLLATVATASLFACGGDDNNNTQTDAGSDAKVPPKDGGGDTAMGMDTGVDSGPPISGSTALTVTVVTNDVGGPHNLTDKGTGVMGAAVRIESSATGGWLEGTTDQSGKVTFMVDMTKAPFDVTAGNMGNGAASIVGVSSQADLNKQLWLPIGTAAGQMAAMYTVHGAIGAAKSASDTFQIDCPSFNTVISAAGATSYSSTQGYYDFDKSDLSMAAIEVDPMNKAVQGVLTPAVARMKAAQQIDIAFDGTTGTVLQPIVSTVKVQFPKTGLWTAANCIPGDGGAPKCHVADTGYTGTKAPYGNTEVATDIGLSAQYRGFATNNQPDAMTGIVDLVITSFPTPMNPDYAFAHWDDGAGYNANIWAKGFKDGDTITLPPITALGVKGPMKGTDLSTVTMDVDASGGVGDYINVAVADGKSQNTFWTIYSPSLKMAGKNLPNLPSTLALTDVGLTSGTCDIFVTATKEPMPPVDYTDSGLGIPKPDWVYSYGVGGIPATGR